MQSCLADGGLQNQFLRCCRRVAEQEDKNMQLGWVAVAARVKLMGRAQGNRRHSNHIVGMLAKARAHQILGRMSLKLIPAATFVAFKDRGRNQLEDK